MRNQDRIKPFLEKLGKLWGENFPDWRFGQLMFNFISAAGDPFHWEEDKFLEKLEQYIVIGG